MSLREQFEAAVITRMKESGFLEVEIRVECLGRSGDGYYDGSIDAYWHFWKESRAALVVDLPTVGTEPEAPEAAIRMRNACFKAIEAAGLKVTP
ncbi:hypothetical protein QN375_06000 [Pseudomonas sp. MH9.2]|uniref:hypothetical protein n=1 Tax=unclassified Pseudomonas TaxID=196821 RepID=UPI002AC8EC83|nr:MULTISPECIES: hypothetical protein [unclassified Pseudomonas]MEB0009336.1 hypothetical protein [Pseudomonas sp. RTB2]MEB0018294.1 hypothetical protein [Pseudomonas sp. RTB3]MEB0025324.1 hypothetical protein [Pseudomonas sp. MH9.2]MEB0147173.1 hypothetical protein [Pseudomonas sp. CCC2.2]MEB0268515.1 hypothetical protein [Pseudomonas sp. 5B4]